MPFADLREFLKHLESAGKLIRIREKVDAKHEIAAYHHDGRGTGMPPTGHHFLKQVPMEASYYQALKRNFPGVNAVHFPACGGTHFLLIVSMKKRLQWEARSLIVTAMGLYGPKFVIVVDEDIDIYNLENVLWAVSNRSQPDEDVLIGPRVLGAPLDPSSTIPRTTAAMGIDATLPLDAPFPEIVEIPETDKVPDFWHK